MNPSGDYRVAVKEAGQSRAGQNGVEMATTSLGSGKNIGQFYPKRNFAKP